MPPASDSAAALASLTGLLDGMGFAPEPRPDAGEIVLRACPFEAVARDHRKVVCSIHLGLVERAVAKIGGGITVDGLDPFRSEQPLVCAIRIRAAAQPALTPKGVP
jgi:predicted ArsR family transcriptional regulator